MNPPDRIDALWMIRAALDNVQRRAKRAGADGHVAVVHIERIRRAIGKALHECDRARQAGAVLPVRREIVGESVEMLGALPLPTEAEHAADWSGLG